MSARTTTPTRWFTTKQAAEYSACSVPTIRRAVQAGHLKAFVVRTNEGASRHRYRQQDLDAWLSAAPVAATDTK